MKRYLSLTLTALTISIASFAQSSSDSKPHFGIKGGYNIASIAGTTPNFKPETKNGFMAGAFYSSQPKSGMGYRTELVFSRQGFSFDENGKKEEVTNDYIYMPHFTTIGITKYFQLQLGLQAGYLLRSSKTNNSTTKDPLDITEIYNRLDYGAAGGVEIFPFKGLILGGRYNLSFGKLYKEQDNGNIPGSPMPLPFPLPVNPPKIKGKSAVVNFYVGYKF